MTASEKRRNKCPHRLRERRRRTHLQAHCVEDTATAFGGHEVHDAAPLVGATVAGGQLGHLLGRPVENVPAGHIEHVEEFGREKPGSQIHPLIDVAPGGDLLNIGQLLHLSFGSAAESLYVSAAHGRHMPSAPCITPLNPALHAAWRKKETAMQL